VRLPSEYPNVFFISAEIKRQKVILPLFFSGNGPKVHLPINRSTLPECDMFSFKSMGYCPYFLYKNTVVVTAYGIEKYLVNRLNIKGIERIEKTKLARIN
jgi:hypothetical protein